MQTTDPKREAFEREHAKLFPYHTNYAAVNGEYIDVHCQLAYKLWNAALSTRSDAPCPHVYTSKGGTSHCTLAAASSDADSEVTEVLSPNPYVSVDHDYNANVRFFVRGYSDYYDFIELVDGKCVRCIRIKAYEQATQNNHGEGQ